MATLTKKYNLEENCLTVIQAMINDHRDVGLTNVMGAKLLGVSERTFYRWLLTYKIKLPKGKRPPKKEPPIKKISKRYTLLAQTKQLYNKPAVEPTNEDFL